MQRAERNRASTATFPASVRTNASSRAHYAGIDSDRSFVFCCSSAALHLHPTPYRCCLLLANTPCTQRAPCTVYVVFWLNPHGTVLHPTNTTRKPVARRKTYKQHTRPQQQHNTGTQKRGVQRRHRPPTYKTDTDRYSACTTYTGSHRGTARHRTTAQRPKLAVARATSASVRWRIGVPQTCAAQPFRTPSHVRCEADNDKKRRRSPPLAV